MDILEKYRSDVAAGHVSADPGQERVAAKLSDLQRRLQAGSAGSGWSRWFTRKPAAPVRGLYIWGGVGRGKTYLMDLFFSCVPIQRKTRTHFHRFMQQVHRGLTLQQGAKNPLQLVANELSQATQLLCFDEFFVLDIGDAMILAGLLEALLDRGMVLVVTSNLPPEKLYENGLQRARFLPAIELIKQHLEIVEIEAGVDYRLRSLTQARLYHYPLSGEAEARLRQDFLDLAPDRDDMQENFDLQILGRSVRCRYSSGDVAWFDFTSLCAGPRSANDYVELARLYHALLLSDVPQLDDTQAENARRFINLIDELYDRRVKLIIAAAVPIAELYQGQGLAFEFERTRSRLLEMQSQEYLASRHRG